MQIHTTIFRRRALTLCATGALLFSPLAFAAGPAAAGAQTDASAQYKADVARCKSGQTNQDEATCLREAGAALEEARRNRLSNNAAPGSYRQNALDRCNALPAGQREDCLTQMSGSDTTVKGSVGGGGVLRETTITIPGSVSGSAPGAASGAVGGTVSGTTMPVAQ